MLMALTKCDPTSWCAEWELWNATTTMEAFPDDVVGLTSFSHAWGTAAIGGVVQGLLGIEQTAPGYRTFTVRPRLGSLLHATLQLPTLHGFINVTATPGSVSLAVPCNTAARACLLLSPATASPSGSALPPRLELDGVAVPAVQEGRHLCAEAPVGCAAPGKTRVLQMRQ